MNLFYCVLGVFARINSWLNRVSINGVSLDWAVIFLLPLPFLSYAMEKMEKPGELIGGWILAGVSVLTPILLLLLRFWHNIIYRVEAVESGTADGLVPDENRFQVRASGKFTFDDRNWSGKQRFWSSLLYGTSRHRWFLNAPATLVFKESGEVELTTHDDHARNRFRLRLDDKEGRWQIVMGRDAPPETDRVRFYLGLTVRPGLRIRYVDVRGWSRKVVIIVDSDVERELLSAKFQEAIGSPSDAWAAWAQSYRSRPIDGV